MPGIKLNYLGGNCDGRASNNNGCYHLARTAMIFPVFVFIAYISQGQNTDEHDKISKGKKNASFITVFIISVSVTETTNKHILAPKEGNPTVVCPCCRKSTVMSSVIVSGFVVANHQPDLFF